ncbi:MAG TPA: M20/M25/M40 family metallo-hydrolase [Burkholderiales bacterium]|nr:M20/M25/M40 family metallo-hydrolase [Burkholderiales bacterium]
MFVVLAFATAAVAQEVEHAFQAILAAPPVRKALADIKVDDARTFEEQKTLTEIPSPPFKEQARAAYYVKRLREVGLSDAYIDREGNVIGVRKGRGGGPKLVISAHLDTVFPEGTDVTVKEKDGRYYAPGIGDDTRGLVELLAVIRAMNANALRTVGDVLFVGTVGEEELGDLRGVKALFRDHPDIDGFISVDGDNVSRIVNQATGSHRYEAAFKGPGGHSFGAFGLPSAIHAMGRAIAKISDVKTPSSPKTTFTVGIVRGGTSVNAIAGDARMSIDMRSDGMDELLKLEKTILAQIKEAAAEENRRWNTDAITVELKLIGDRPAGRTPEHAKIVQVARRSLRALGQQPTLDSASTDSNLAMSLGIPAVTISHGGDHQAMHSLHESYKPTEAWLGPQNALLVVLGLAGLDGVSQPLLEHRHGGQR